MTSSQNVIYFSKETTRERQNFATLRNCGLELENLFLLSHNRGSLSEIAHFDEVAVVYLSRFGSRPTLNNKLVKGFFPLEVKGKNISTLKRNGVYLPNSVI